MYIDMQADKTPIHIINKSLKGIIVIMYFLISVCVPVHMYVSIGMHVHVYVYLCWPEVDVLNLS